MSNDFDIGNVPPPSQEQRLNVTRFLIAMMEQLDSMAPRLNDEDVERLRDLDKAMIGGIYTALALLFGKDEADVLRELVQKVYREKHGTLPDLIPRVIASGAEAGVFKRRIYGDLGWENPPNG